MLLTAELTHKTRLDAVLDVFIEWCWRFVFFVLHPIVSVGKFRSGSKICHGEASVTFELDSADLAAFLVEAGFPVSPLARILANFGCHEAPEPSERESTGSTPRTPFTHVPRDAAGRDSTHTSLASNHLRI